MRNEQNVTGRPAYDSSVGGGEQYRSGGSGKILIAVAAFIALFGVILWLGAGTDGTSTGPGMTDPSVGARADPAANSAAPAAAPAAPATEPASPIVDPAAPSADTVPPAPDGTTTTPAPVQ
jgi:hypothetical protein